MYPDLSYLFSDIFGTQPDNFLSIFKMFGLMLIVAFLASGLVLRSELKRKEKEGLLKPSPETFREGHPATIGEILMNALFGFIIGFKVPYISQNFADFKIDPADVLLSMNGNFLIGIILAAIFGGFRYWEANRKKLAKPIIKTIMVQPHERVIDITIWAAVSGIIGAKLFAVIESTDNIKAFMADPLGQLLSGSGLAVWGGIILGTIVVSWYVKRKGMSVIHIMDAAAPAIITGYGVGRLGCQFSGDGDWGIVNNAPTPNWWFLPDSFWAWDYPRNVLQEGRRMADCAYRYCFELSEPVWPTPIYEIFMCAIILAILWALRKRIKPAGSMFFIFLILNGIERFFIEKIRVNPDIEILGMQATQAEYIAILVVLIGVAGLIWAFTRHRKRGNIVS